MPPSTAAENLVIRPRDLMEFVAKANDETTEKPVEKPLDYRERESLDRIILVLSKHAGLDLSKPYKAAGVVQQIAASHRVEPPSSKDTIADKLTAAARYDVPRLES